MSLRIECIRSAKTDKTLDDHRQHPLCEIGSEQARLRRLALGNPVYDLVIYSGLLRTEQTALIVSGKSDRTEFIAVPELFGDEQDPRIQTVKIAFETGLGHAPLKDYFRDDQLKADLLALAREASTELIGLLSNETYYASGRVLVVGHGILLPAIVMDFAKSEHPSLSERALDECEGYCVEVIESPPYTVSDIV